MAKSDIRTWAVKGAEQRLLEIAGEAKAIFASFPELRGRGRGFGASLGGDVGDARKPQARGPRRGRRKISAEGRKRISEAQKARWAKQKAAQGAGATSTAATATKKQSAARKKK